MRPETQLYFSALSIEEFREGDQLELEKHNGAKISQQVETRLRRKVSEKNRKSSEERNGFNRWKKNRIIGQIGWFCFSPSGLSKDIKFSKQKTAKSKNELRHFRLSGSIGLWVMCSGQPRASASCYREPSASQFVTTA